MWATLSYSLSDRGYEVSRMFERRSARISLGESWLSRMVDMVEARMCEGEQGEGDLQWENRTIGAVYRNEDLSIFQTTGAHRAATVCTSEVDAIYQSNPPPSVIRSSLSSPLLFPHTTILYDSSLCHCSRALHCDYLIQQAMH